MLFDYESLSDTGGLASAVGTRAGLGSVVVTLGATTCTVGVVGYGGGRLERLQCH